MEGLGEKLKETRESMGLSLRDVEEATKIRTKYIRALENEAFEEIPGKTYAKGFIKNYAKFLNVDPTEMLEAFEKHYSKSFQEPEFTPASDVSEATPSMRENRLFKYGLVLAVILILFISSTLWSNYKNDKNPVPQNPNTNNAANTPEEDKKSEVAEEPTEPDETQPPEVVKGVKLEIQIIKEQCWLKVISDGKELFAGTLNQGDQRVFEGDSEVVITLGNAGAAKVIYNGEELPPLGAEGEVVTPPPFVSKHSQT